jgi:hypothetical protein
LGDYEHPLKTINGEFVFARTVVCAAEIAEGDGFGGPILQPPSRLDGLRKPLDPFPRR